MKTKFLVLLFTITCGLNAQTTKIEPYVNFIKENQTDPVEYIFQLFDKYDIVVLGERDHRDTVQYELINKIISDKRFIDKVGRIFTEVGVNNQKDRINKVLKGSYKNEKAVEDALMEVYIDMQPPLIWEKYNYWILLKHIYNTNKELHPNKKITYYPTNPSFDFKDFTSLESWAKIMGTGFSYDSIMASNFIKDYEYTSRNDKRGHKKALVIMNRPHSYRMYNTKSGKISSMVSYIVSEYPDKVANIMINWVCPNNKGQNFLVAQGKWDAAFKYLSNPSVGFDLENSPFGNDLFDHYDKPNDDVRYKDIYTGFIFYKPMEEWKLAMGIPGYAKKEFLPELIRRAKILLQIDNDENALKILMTYNEIKMYAPYQEHTPKEKVEEYINYWLE